MGQTPRSRPQGKKYWYPQKDLITGNIYVKYQSSRTHCLKVISNVKVFKKWVKLQGQGHRVKNNGTHGNFLSQGILIWNIKALSFTVQKLLARLKFQRGGQNDRMTEWQTGQKQMPSICNLGGIKIKNITFFLFEINEHKCLNSTKF